MKPLHVRLCRGAIRALIIGLMTPTIRGPRVVGDRRDTPGLGNGADAAIQSSGRMYYANHLSIADFALLWSSLPGHERERTRIVAAKDYWTRNPIRRFLAEDVFDAILVERDTSDDAREKARANSTNLRNMAKALNQGQNIILFPEGRRGHNPDQLLPFQPGLYALARLVKGVEMVPVWLGNLHQSLPKSSKLPLPLICQVQFGPGVTLEKGEDMDTFARRSSSALLDTHRTMVAAQGAGR